MSGGGLLDVLKLLRKDTTNRATRSMYEQRLERIRHEMPNAGEVYQPGVLAGAIRHPSPIASLDPSRFERAAYPLDPGRVDGMTGEPIPFDQVNSLSQMNIRSLADMMVKGKSRWNSLPFLQMQNKGLDALPTVVAHEGRHRNRALAQLGYEKNLAQVSPFGERGNPIETAYQEGFKPQLQHYSYDGAGPERRPWSDVFTSEPFKDGGEVDRDQRAIGAGIGGIGALAALNPRTRALGKNLINKAHTGFMRSRTPVGIYAESMSSNLPKELRSSRTQDMRYMNAMGDTPELWKGYKGRLQGAWNDPEEGMQFNHLYAHEMPPTNRRVDNYGEALIPAAKLGSRLEQWGVPVQREMPRLFNEPEGSDALMMRNMPAGALRQLAEKMKDQNIAIGHRPGNQAVAFSLADQPPSIQDLHQMLSQHVNPQDMRYAVSNPGVDRTMTGMEPWMGLPYNNLPSWERRTPEFAKREKKLLTGSDE